MSNRIELGVVLLAGGGVFVDAGVRQAQEDALRAAERAIVEERQRAAAVEASKEANDGDADSKSARSARREGVRLVLKVRS